MFQLRKDQFYLTVDAAVFTILDKQLKLLLIRRKYPPFEGRYALPGGFVRIDEFLKQAVGRELEEETGVKGIFLQKLPAFGDVGRDPRGRVITIPYLALINSEEVRLHSTGDAELARWQPVYELPELAFDHQRIIDVALSKLRDELERTNIAADIMPARFTLTELQTAYEIILDRKLDKRNFRKRLRELSMVKELSETKMEGAHRPARLYSFRSKDHKGI